MSDIVITGVPRSGTTLTCHLLNSLPDTVALHEPMIVAEFGKLDGHPAIGKEIQRFFDLTRTSILEQGTAPSKQVAGAVPDNPMGARGQEGTFSLRRFLVHLPRRLTGSPDLRKSRASRGRITIEKDLSPKFRLCIKHPSAFTALLSELVTRFPAYAIVRNPLAILGSWNSIEFPPGRGRAPAAERLDLELTRTLRRTTNRYDRQMHLLAWYFDAYIKNLPDDQVIRYEDIVQTGGAALSVITMQAVGMDVPLENQNKNKAYNRKVMSRLGERLLHTDGPYWAYYTKNSVETLLNQLATDR